MQAHKIIVNGQARLAILEPKRISYRRPAPDNLRSYIRKQAAIDPNFQRARNLIILEMISSGMSSKQIAKVFMLSKARILQMKKSIST